MEISKLYEKDLYLNRSKISLFSTEIIEYDMSEAGFSLIREFKLLPDSKINQLSLLSKHDRTIRIGKIQKKDREFSKALMDAFKKARRLFFELNELTDSDILSVKKDAILTLKKCPHQEIGTYINFREKHNYTSYMYTGFLEIYYNPRVFEETGMMDIKGISDEKLKLHQDYLIKFLGKLFKRVETDSKESTLRFMRRFVDQYKSYELDVGYYRTFDGDSVFIESDGDITYEEYWEDRKNELDIRFNYINLLIPLTKIIL